MELLKTKTYLGQMKLGTPVKVARLFLELLWKICAHQFDMFVVVCHLHCNIMVVPILRIRNGELFKLLLEFMHYNCLHCFSHAL